MTRQPFKLFIFLYFVFNAYIIPQIVEKLDIISTNDEELIYADINKMFVDIKYSPTVLDSIKIILSKKLNNEGFNNFIFNNSSVAYNQDSSKVEIKIVLNKGFQTFVKDFYITGLDLLDSSYVYENLSFLKDKVINVDEIESNFYQFINQFENSGYPFSIIKVNSVIVSTDSIEEKDFADIYLSFNKEKKSSIDSIEVEGNTKTKDYVVIRNLRFKDGEQYSQSKLEEIPKRLNRLRFFEPVESPEYYFNKDNVGILKIKVKELETNNFDGVLGYVPSTDDKQKGYFTGYVNISLRNVFGTGRGASIKWQQIDRHSQEFDLKYLEPWVFNYPFNINLGLYQKKQDTSYVQRKFDLSLEYLATEDISASVLLSTQSTIPTESEYSKFTVYNSTTLQTGVSFSIDTRDDIYAPREGIYFVTSYKFNSKKINGPEKYLTEFTKKKIELQKYEFEFNYFYEVWNRQILSLNLTAKEMRGDLFEVSDLFELGGTNSLRGYREKQFLGNRVMWSNFEFRSLLSKRSYAFIFYDNGYYLRNENKDSNIEKQSAYKYGYGFGLSLETAVGVLKVSYAIGDGMGLSDGLIHFGIANEF